MGQFYFALCGLLMFSFGGDSNKQLVELYFTMLCLLQFIFFYKKMSFRRFSPFYGHRLDTEDWTNPSFSFVLSLLRPLLFTHFGDTQEADF